MTRQRDRKLGLKRLAAFGIDSVIIWIGLSVIMGLTHTGGPMIVGNGETDFAARLSLYSQVFLTLGAPTFLYLTLSEAFGWRATIGKRALGLRADGHVLRVALRNGLKLLPIELISCGIWFGSAVPLVTGPNAFGWTLIALAITLFILSFGLLFIGDSRTHYDRLSGTSVHLNPR